MRRVKSIYEWWKGKRKLDALPFEELQSTYAEDPVGAYKEFVRRLSRLVFFAATAYLKKVDPKSSQAEIEQKVERIFREFSPQFTSGDPQKILLRFADVIRNELDDATFSALAFIKPFSISSTGSLNLCASKWGTSSSLTSCNAAANNRRARSSAMW